MVYNLSVEDVHEYYANGVLVSNCDALRYILSYLKGDQLKVHELLEAIIDSRKPSIIDREALPETPTGGVTWIAAYAEYHVYAVKDGQKVYTYATSDKTEAIRKWEEMATC